MLDDIKKLLWLFRCDDVVEVMCKKKKKSQSLISSTYICKYLWMKWDENPTCAGKGTDEASLSICWYLLKLDNRCMRAYYTVHYNLSLF